MEMYWRRLEAQFDQGVRDLGTGNVGKFVNGWRKKLHRAEIKRQQDFCIEENRTILRRLWGKISNFLRPSPQERPRNYAVGTKTTSSKVAALVPPQSQITSQRPRKRGTQGGWIEVKGGPTREPSSVDTTPRMRGVAVSGTIWERLDVEGVENELADESCSSISAQNTGPLNSNPRSVKGQKRSRKGNVAKEGVNRDSPQPLETASRTKDFNERENGARPAQTNETRGRSSLNPHAAPFVSMSAFEWMEVYKRALQWTVRTVMEEIAHMGFGIGRQWKRGYGNGPIWRPF